MSANKYFIEKDINGNYELLERTREYPYGSVIGIYEKRREALEMIALLQDKDKQNA